MSMNGGATQPALSPLAQLVTSNIRTAMRVAGITQAELGRALGLPQSSISDRLRGRVAWTVDELGLAAELLAVPLSQLMAEAA